MDLLRVGGSLGWWISGGWVSGSLELVDILSWWICWVSGSLELVDLLSWWVCWVSGSLELMDLIDWLVDPLS